MRRLGSDPQRGMADDAARKKLGQRRLPALSDSLFARPWRALPDMVFLLIGAILLVYLAFTRLHLDVLAILSMLALLWLAVQGLHRWTRYRLALRPNTRPLSARVLRGGRDLFATAEELVAGDIVFLEPGDAVLADMRLLETDRLVMDEHALTAGRDRVHKQTQPVDSAAPLALRSDMAFAGSYVVAGYGKAVVTATGGQTEQSVLQQLQGSREKQGLGRDIRQAQAVMRRAAYVALLVVAGLFLFGLLGQQIQLHELFYVALVMVLAAVPFFLPLALQIVDYWGALALADKRVHIRAPEAVALMQGVDVLLFGQATPELIARLDAAELQALGARAVFCVQTRDGKMPALPASVRSMRGDTLVHMEAEAAQQEVLRHDLFFDMDRQACSYLIAALQASGRSVAYIASEDAEVPLMREADCAISLGDTVSPYMRSASDVVLGDTPVLDSLKAARAVGLRIIDVWHFLLTAAAAKGSVLTWAILSGSILPLAPLQLLYTAFLATPLLAACIAMTPRAELPAPMVSVRGVRARKRLLFWTMAVGCLLLSLGVYGGYHGHYDRVGDPYAAGTLAWLVLLLMEVAVMCLVGGFRMLTQPRVLAILAGLCGVQGLLLSFAHTRQLFLAALPAPGVFSLGEWAMGLSLLAMLVLLAFMRRWWLRVA